MTSENFIYVENTSDLFEVPAKLSNDEVLSLMYQKHAKVQA